MAFQIENGVLKKYTEEPGVTKVVIPDSVTSIGEYAFYKCSSLTTVTIPDSVTSIGNAAFWDCKGLKDKNGFVIIRGVLYNYFGQKKAVVIPDGVTSIGASAFRGCSRLTTVTIGDSVTSIGEWAFYECLSLIMVTIPDSVTEIGSSAFSGTPWLNNYPNDLVIVGKGVLHKYNKYKGTDANVVIPASVTMIGDEAFYYCTSLTSITLPESVTSIGNGAFYGCSSLTTVTIPDSVTEIGSSAFSGTPWLNNYPNDLVIVGKGVLYKYKGKDTNVVIPDSVTSIGCNAFYECSSLTTVTIPDSVTSIGYSAFDGCKNLQYIQANSKLNILDMPNSGNPLVIKKSGENYRFFAVSYKSSGSSYNDFVKTRLWNNYDMELINNGPKYKYRMPSRLFGGLDRLLHPVDLTEENRQFYIELLKKNVKKIIAVAEEINCPFAVRALFDLNIIDDSNAKAAKKLITASQVPEIAALSELFGAETEKPKAKKKAAPKKSEPEVPADPLTAEYRDKLTAIKGDDIIKKMKLIGTKFPEVKLQDGTNAPGELFKFIIASYGASDNYTINEEADKAAALLSYDSLCEAIAAISNGLDLTLYPLILPVVCRFGNPDQIKAVIKYYDTLKGARGKKLQEKIESALAMSDTRVAVLWLEKKGDLSGFARVHNISEEQVYDKYLYDFGFDEQGKRVFDLGTTTIEATISLELTLSLLNTTTGKTVRSIPKKGVAPAVQKKAADELADMKATLKKAAKLKNDRLYQDYIEAADTPGNDWKERYLKNPFLYAIARILIWTQDGKTFTLADHKAIDSQGAEYEISDKPIRLAHTMEMDKADIEAWRKYFGDNKLKQPFIQIWEQPINKAFFKEDRYKNCPIRDYYLKKQEKRGISIEWYSGYYSESHYLSIGGFDVDYESVMTDGHDMVEITSIKPQKWNRRANMVLSFLDRITFYGRILKDDPTIGTLLDSFTLPQIMSFIDLATKNECVNATAVLLNYRNEHYPEYNGFAALDDLLLDDDF